MVYQHQENIRAVLTQEPKDRNEALDRLFGLSDYRNIIEGIKKITGENTPTKRVTLNPPERKLNCSAFPNPIPA